MPQPADTARFVVAGLDLSGPSNPEDTALAWFALLPDGPAYRGHRTGVTDRELLETLGGFYAGHEVILGIDAPLSYRDGGGRRDCDADLGAALGDADRSFVGVMAPTYSKMGWLTLRGVGLTRTIELMPQAHRIRIVEVHPGAAMALRGAPAAALQNYKAGNSGHLRELADWLGRAGLGGIPAELRRSSHGIDACAAALAAWKWHDGRPAWLAEAAPPARPYDFAC